MIDQSHVNLLSLLPGQYKRVGQTGGGEYHGPCPFCGGRDRFAVWPKGDNGGHWWCRQCGKSGDSLSFLMAYKTLSFKDACVELRCIVPDEPNRTPSHKTLQPDIYASDLKDAACFDPRWQGCAEDFAYACAGRLWDDWRGAAGQYLEQRGITRNQAVAAFLGVNEASYEGLWGSVGVYLPRGITIPWLMDGQTFYNLRVRRPNADLVGTHLAKYASPKGYANGMYGIDSLMPGDVAYVTEGEFDALVLKRYLLDSGVFDAAVISIGSNGGGRVIRWIARLALAKKIILVLDSDGKSDQAAEYWLKVLGRKAVWKRPSKKDITELWQAGELATWMRESA